MNRATPLKVPHCRLNLSLWQGAHLPTRCCRLKLWNDSERSQGFASNLNIHTYGVSQRESGLWSHGTCLGHKDDWVNFQKNPQTKQKSTLLSLCKTFQARRKKTDLTGLKNWVYLHLKSYSGFQGHSVPFSKSLQKVPLQNLSCSRRHYCNCKFVIPVPEQGSQLRHTFCKGNKMLLFLLPPTHFFRFSPEHFCAGQNRIRSIPFSNGVKEHFPQHDSTSLTQLTTYHLIYLETCCLPGCFWISSIPSKTHLSSLSSLQSPQLPHIEHESLFLHLLQRKLCETINFPSA